MEVRTKNAVSVIRILIAGAMVLAGVVILVLSMTGSNAANKDFVTYWAAGKQLVRHANPYDAAEILRLEREAGCKEHRPYFMRNPPTALFLALPFGFMNEWWAVMVWSLMLIVSLVASIRMIWVMEGRPPGRLHLLGYIFPPVVECMTVGQVGILLLLGFVGFLYFHKSRPVVAGLLLALCATKPHLFVPLAAVLALWCVARKDYKILLGLSAALAGCLLVTHIVDPAAWVQYFRMMKAENLQNEPIPTISLLFRAAIDVHAMWLQFVPMMAGTAWAIWYFRRSDWRWEEQGLLLLSVSVMVAPYAWFTDEAVVLPAVLHGVYRLAENRRSLTPLLIVVLPALVAVLVGKPINSMWYVWTSPAWFGFCLYAMRSEPKFTAVEA